MFHGDRYWSQKKEGFLLLIISFSFIIGGGGGGGGGRGEGLTNMKSIEKLIPANQNMITFATK